MSKDFYVYLAGPMAALTPEDANNWRLHAYDRMTPHGITVVSPMREKEMLENGTIMGVDYSMYGDVPELRAQSIFTRDTYDVDHANLVLANMTDTARMQDVDGRWWDIPSVGSDAEIFRAQALGIKVALVAPPDNYYRKHPFPIAAANIIFDHLDPAMDWIINNFRPYRR